MKRILLSALVVSVCVGVFAALAPEASAVVPADGGGESNVLKTATECKGKKSECPKKSKGDPAVTACKKDGGGNRDKGTKCDLVGKYLNPFIRLLSAAVGVVVVIGIIAGGIQYSASAGDPQKAAAGKQKIRNALIALVAYLFLYAFLEWVIPGGFI